MPSADNSPSFLMTRITIDRQSSGHPLSILLPIQVTRNPVAPDTDAVVCYTPHYDRYYGLMGRMSIDAPNDFFRQYKTLYALANQGLATIESDILGSIRTAGEHSTYEIAALGILSSPESTKRSLSMHAREHAIIFTPGDKTSVFTEAAYRWGHRPNTQKRLFPSGVDLHIYPTAGRVDSDVSIQFGVGTYGHKPGSAQNITLHFMRDPYARQAMIDALKATTDPWTVSRTINPIGEGCCGSSSVCGCATSSSLRSVEEIHVMIPGIPGQDRLYTLSTQLPRRLKDLGPCPR